MLAKRDERDDAALVAACRQGDESAWESLIKRYQRLIYSIPRRAGLGDDLAAEVFQQVFTKLVEQLERIEQPARIQAWLVTLARRESLRLLQKENSTSRLDFDDSDEDAKPDDPPDQSPLADEIITQMQQQHLVRDAVLSLDDRCRQLLVMLFYRSEPPPYSEIANELGTTEGSIGPTRARCLEKLHRLLKQQGF